MSERTYIFSRMDQAIYTTDNREFRQMLNNEDFDYKGWIDSDNGTFGGPKLAPMTGSSTPL